VAVDSEYFRPTEVDLLKGDPSKAKARLGWQHRTSFAELVREMVDADRAALRARTRMTPPSARAASGE
jgi:GDPmannose 4,6-dehydratase